MQFSLVSATTLLAIGAAAAPVVENVQVMRSVDAETTEAGGGLVARQSANDLAFLDVFRSSGCSNYITTVITSLPGGGQGAPNGQCFQLGQNPSSIRTTFLRGSCTLTVYTDQFCSNGARAARVNVCNSGNWRSYSVDNCS